MALWFLSKNQENLVSSEKLDNKDSLREKQGRWIQQSRADAETD